MDRVQLKRSIQKQLDEIYRRYQSAIDRASAETGIPKEVIIVMIYYESGGNPRAVSRAGARGLMQLMPRTARALGVQNVFNPEENIMAGARYLRQLLDRYNNNLSLALAAYNAGPGRVRNRIPRIPETQRYVRNIQAILKLYDRTDSALSSFQMDSANETNPRLVSKDIRSVKSVPKRSINPWKEFYKLLLMIPPAVEPRSDHVNSSGLEPLEPLPKLPSIEPFIPFSDQETEND